MIILAHNLTELDEIGKDLLTVLLVAITGRSHGVTYLDILVDRIRELIFYSLS
jgi:hypothetical protein